MEQVASLIDPWRNGVPPLSASPPGALDLSGSGGPLGCSPYAARRAIEAVGSCAPVPIETAAAFCQTLSRTCSVTVDRISIAAGSRALLPALLRTTSGRVAWPAPPPPLHVLAARLAGCDTAEITPPANTWVRRERPSVVLLSHPNNPTGEYWRRDEMRAVLDAAAAVDAMVVVDEAYADYAEAADFPRMAVFLDDYENLVVTRSFSSCNGLQCLPLAYALSSRTVAERTRPWLLASEPAEVAMRAAMAAQEETSFQQMVVDRVGRSRFRLLNTLKEWKVEARGGQGPWVMVAAQDVSAACRQLAARGVRVRDLTEWGWHGWLRVRAGQDDEVSAFLTAARPVLTGR